MNNKMNAFRFLLTLLIMVVAFSCDYNEDEDIGPKTSNHGGITANGPIVSQTLEVDDFHSISAAMVGRVFLTQGSPQELRIETPQNILDILEIEVNNGVLEMKFDESVNMDVEDFSAYITMPEINSLTFAGVGELVAQNDLNIDNLFINLSGVGNISLQGEVDHLEIITAGLGNVNAFDMTCNSCTIISSGLGKVEVTVVEDLSATLSGLGNIFYKGHPSISSSITGVGQIIDAN